MPPTPTHHGNDPSGTLILREFSLSPQRRKRSNSSNLLQMKEPIIGSRSSLNRLSNIGKQRSAPEVKSGMLF